MWAVTRRKKVLVWAGAVMILLSILWLFLQHCLPHLHPAFLPDYPQADLTSTLSSTALSPRDYITLYHQTGLSPAAIDDLLAQGDTGVDQILSTQSAFFHPQGQNVCGRLGITTREHRYRDADGKAVAAVPLAPLREGDILVSFSTHTAGWTHGHAGLVLDPETGVTLESVVLGTRSSAMNVNHWRAYTTIMVLRPKADDATRHRVVELAREHLENIPYSLVSGAFGDKFQPLNGPHNAHCGYLPWYAWMAAADLDLDADGGHIVAPMDLALSPNVEVVQLFGVDPRQFPLDFEG